MPGDDERDPGQGRTAAREEQRDEALCLADDEERAAADHRLQQVQQLRVDQGPARHSQRRRLGAQPVQRQHQRRHQCKWSRGSFSTR
jgi:hypothetical protein